MHSSRLQTPPTLRLTVPLSTYSTSVGYWVLVTWLDVLHGLCFGIIVTFVLFTFLAVYARWRAHTTTPTSPNPHKRIADWNRGYGEFHDLPLCGINRTSRPAESDTKSTRRRRRRTFIIGRNIRSHFDKFAPKNPTRTKLTGALARATCAKRSRRRLNAFRAQAQ